MITFFSNENLNNQIGSSECWPISVSVKSTCAIHLATASRMNDSHLIYIFSVHVLKCVRMFALKIHIDYMNAYILVELNSLISVNM